MIALGHELGADHDIDRTRFHRPDEFRRAKRRPDGVGGDDRSSSFRKQLGDLVGDAFDPWTAGNEAVLLAAFGTGFWWRHHMPAMVTGEPVHQPVLDHPSGAVGALETMAAVAAQGERSEAAAVQKEQRLLAAPEVRFEFIDQSWR